MVTFWRGLYIFYLRSIYEPIARNPEIIELCGNQVNLKVLGIEIPARELVKHWSSLEDYRGFKFMMIFCEWLVEGVNGNYGKHHFISDYLITFIMSVDTL